MKIDVKSLVTGILVSVVVFFALGASYSTGSHPCGRYQIEASDGNNVYVIDTRTGQVWSKSSTDRETFYKAKNISKQGYNAEK